VRPFFDLPRKGSKSVSEKRSAQADARVQAC
jgi:hypothetical protein